MPFPKLATGRLDAQLTNISLAITNIGFIHDKIFPVVPNLAQESGVIAKFADDAHLRVYESIRSIGDEGQHRIEYKRTNDLKYQIEFHDLSHYIDNREMDQVQKPFDAKRDGLDVLESSRNMEMEVALATVLADATVLTNNSTPSTLWDDPTSDPLGDMTAANGRIRLRKGRKANKAWTNQAVIDVLQTHPQFVSKYSGGGVVTTLSQEQVIDIIKKHLNIEKVEVGVAIKATSRDGQTLTKGEVWADDFGLYYAPNKASVKTPSFGYRFEMAGANKRVSSRLEPIAEKGILVELDWAYQDKILDVDSAELLDQVIS